MTSTSPYMQQIGQAAQQASRRLATISTGTKNAALICLADELHQQQQLVLEANQLDDAAGRAKGISDSLLDRMLLTPERLDSLEADIRSVVDLPDPVGTTIDGSEREDGLRLSRRRIPIGVIGVIYEARPNVTLDIAALCLKTGNAVILRGGSDIQHSNRALMQVIHASLEKAEVDLQAVQIIGDPNRAYVTELLRLDDYVDMIIPRGGGDLHKLCRDKASMPVITGGIGICHYFVDSSVDQTGALKVIENAKVQRPSVCNALDTLLVHRSIAAEFIPKVAEHMAACKVELRLTKEALSTLNGQSNGATVRLASEDDFVVEWMSLVLGIRVVDSMDEAIDHIQTHSMDHSDGILTNDLENATRFVDEVNSSAVFVNASTRFNDGGQFGLGAEVAVSTQKLHARGPLGLEALTSYKWVVQGQMHVRS